MQVPVILAIARSALSAEMVSWTKVSNVIMVISLAVLIVSLRLDITAGPILEVLPFATRAHSVVMLLLMLVSNAITGTD